MSSPLEYGFVLRTLGDNTPHPCAARHLLSNEGRIDDGAGFGTVTQLELYENIVAISWSTGSASPGYRLVDISDWITGTWLAVCLSALPSTSDSWNSFLVLKLPFSIFFPSFHLISPSTLLISDLGRVSIDIYSFANTLLHDANGLPPLPSPVLVASYRLPEPADGVTIGFVIPHALSYSVQFPSAKRSPQIIAVRCVFRMLGQSRFAELIINPCDFVLPSHSASDAFQPCTYDWDEWGPRRTRWILPSENMTLQVFPGNLVLYGPTDGNQGPAHILDFNRTPLLGPDSPVESRNATVRFVTERSVIKAREENNLFKFDVYSALPYRMITPNEDFWPPEGLRRVFPSPDAIICGTTPHVSDLFRTCTGSSRSPSHFLGTAKPRFCSKDNVTADRAVVMGLKRPSLADCRLNSRFG
jgi:hypothetical protein